MLAIREQFILDQEGFIISSNLNIANVTGYDDDDVIGRHLSIFYPLNLSRKANSDLEKARKNTSHIVISSLYKKRGISFWAKMKIKWIDPSPSEKSKFFISLEDATHRILNRDRIRLLKDEYLSVFNNSFVGTFKFKGHGFRIQRCNLKLLEILGKNTSVGLSIDSFFEDIHQFESFISLLKRNKRIEGFKFLIKRDNGNKHTWAAICARWFEGQGFAEGVIIDISEQYLQMEELKRLNTELDNFVYHASHDLRSPLTSIMGLINLTENEASMEGVKPYLGMMRERINHLDLILKDLVAVSYNHSAKVLCEIFHFENEVNFIVGILINPRQKIKVTVDVMQGCDFFTDPVRMRSILRNLLANAFQYYNPMISNPCVNLIVHIDSSKCKIHIKDNGIGIHPNFTDRVYNMFFRATESSKGSGLGLYIVKSMVNKLQGDISLVSELNKGTAFVLTIPNRAPEEKDQDICISENISSFQSNLI